MFTCMTEGRNTKFRASYEIKNQRITTSKPMNSQAMDKQIKVRKLQVTNIDMMVMQETMSFLLSVGPFI